MASHIAQVFIAILAIVLLNSCFAQLTFSPNWGKRSGSNQLDIGNSASPNLNNNDNSIGDSAFRFGNVRNVPSMNGNNCKPSIDSVMLIYRMIQAEAEKLNDCDQK
ncbi:red pigment-concentrating prohormone-like [Sitodiplosis mosellana]|uniref:red pigment-concentrating prohormone-like n=1 Tax=Sitodiplosis mosellana TaxID=263140 RepID=UPI0024451A89|nr:red pigment-concentrating prohormone-like [Sitodiplosis mosellana]